MIERHEEFRVEVDVRRRHVFVEIREATDEELRTALAQLPEWEDLLDPPENGGRAVFLKYVCSCCGVSMAGTYPRGSIVATTCDCYRMFQALEGGKAG